MNFRRSLPEIRWQPCLSRVLPLQSAPPGATSKTSMSMQRRNFLESIGASALLGLAGPRQQMAQEQVARATRAMPIPKIEDISVIECQPDGVRLTVVKISTDQDGLYGYGCATFTQRADLVKPAVERYLKPFLL